MTVQLCLAPHRDNPPRALGGLRLCAGHHGALLDALTGPSAADDPTIDALWGARDWGRIVVHDSREAAYAAAHPDDVVCGDGTAWHDPHDYRPGGLTRDWTALTGLTGHRTASAPHVTGTADTPLPINPAVADLRDHITAALAGWARIHVEELPATAPAAYDPATVSTWLARCTDWAAAQPWAGEYVAELTDLHRRARNLIDLPRPRRAAVAPCLERVDGQRCTGTLYTTAREPNDPTPVVIQCDTCPAAYGSTQWERLGKRLKRAERTAA